MKAARTGLWLMLALGMLTATMVAPRRASAAAENGGVVFSRGGGGENRDLFRYDPYAGAPYPPNGPSGITQITNTGDAAETWPSLSPDGMRIVYVRTLLATHATDLWIINLDGTNAHALTTDGASKQQPAWSSDGTHILFVTSDAGTAYPYVASIAADGSQYAAITRGQVGVPDRPSYSPDNSKILYALDAGAGFDVYTINTDWSGSARLTSAAGDELEPSWSPSGTRIVYRQRKSKGDAIWVMNPDGSCPALIRDEPVLRTPGWSPDGQRIVLSGNFGLFSVDPYGQAVTVMTTGVSDLQPAWGVHTKVECENDCSQSLEACNNWEDNLCWCNLEYKQCMAQCGTRVPGPSKCSGTPR